MIQSRTPMYSDCNGLKQDERGYIYKILMVAGAAVRVDQNQPRRVSNSQAVLPSTRGQDQQPWPWPIGRKVKPTRVEVKK